MSSSCVCLPPFCLLASRFEARSLLLMLLVARLFCGAFTIAGQQHGHDQHDSRKHMTGSNQSRPAIRDCELKALKHRP
jgi:hypothetical protein